MRIDLHTHSTESDGTDTPTELVDRALAADLDVIALTDHDGMHGAVRFAEAAAEHGGWDRAALEDEPTRRAYA